MMETHHAHGYAAQLVFDVQSLIDATNKGTMAPCTAYEDISAMLSEHGIVKEKVLQVDELGVHPSNRGRLGLNGHNVHRNGHEVDKVGCDLKELNKAAAFELCPLQPRRGEQFAFNQKVIAGSEGLLAPLTGQESHLTVGTGHWTAWVRAIKASCRTPFADMTDGKGNFLLADRFRKKDKRMATCIDVGWSWRTFPWQTEIAWPALPDLCQRALNASQSVSSRSTELEVMVWASEADRDGSSTDDVIQTLQLNSPQCAPYLQHVAKLAQAIGGGPTAPLLHLLDRVQKLYGENKMFGEEFLSAVYNLNLMKSVKVVHIKCACLATNLVTDKVVDGISRLLTKTDVDKLKGNKERTIAINDMIDEAMRILDQALSDGYLSQEVSDSALAKFMVRY